MSAFAESNFENAVLELLQEHLGYRYLYGPEIIRDYSEPVLKDIFYSCVNKLNPKVHPEAIAAACKKALLSEQPSLIENNAAFHEMLTGGAEVSYFDREVKNARVRLIDFDNPENNDFLAVNQYTVTEHKEKRPDIVIFINGLPLVVMELKSCSREDADTSEAYRQLRNYFLDVPLFFTYNAFCIIYDMVNAKAGTITSPEDRFMAWKSIDGSKVIESPVQYETLVRGMFDKSRLLDIIKNYIMFQRADKKLIKVLGGYHQYFAVRKAVKSAVRAASEKGGGKGGVFWHTQGSGKSYSMVFFSRIITEPLQNPTIVVITDRNDLDNQLYQTFCDSAGYLRQTPVQAQNRVDLKGLLKNREAGGIIFTTMQKFEEDTDVLSRRRNIILIADEAHRSQYGLKAKVRRDTGKVTFGLAKYIRDALPNATFIGFTGTPVELLDRSTREVFGEYIDIYDMTQSVSDKATVPIYYENRIMNLRLDEDVLRKIDEAYNEMSANAEEYDIEKSKKQMSQMESILGADETIKALSEDIIKHYEDRAYILEGKAMVICYSRVIAVKIYYEVLRMRAGWKDKIKIVMTGDNNDPEEWHSLTGDKEYRGHKDISTTLGIYPML